MTLKHPPNSPVLQNVYNCIEIEDARVRLINDTDNASRLVFVAYFEKEGCEIAEFMRLALHYPEIKTVICVSGIGEPQLQRFKDNWPWVGAFDVLDGADDSYEIVKAKAVRASLSERPDDDKDIAAN